MNISQTIRELLQLAAKMQASFFLGACIVILYHVLWRDRKNLRNRWPSVALFVGMIPLVIATDVTFYRLPYVAYDVWYFLVASGYVIVDVTIIIAFRRELREWNRKQR